MLVKEREREGRIGCMGEGKGEEGSLGYAGDRQGEEGRLGCMGKGKEEEGGIGYAGERKGRGRRRRNRVRG